MRLIRWFFDLTDCDRSEVAIKGMALGTVIGLLFVALVVYFG